MSETPFYSDPAKEPEWWIDYDYWPGPYRESVGLQGIMDLFIEGIKETEKTFVTLITNQVKEVERRNIGKGLTTGHGPRSRTTFDRQGRRRY